MMTTTFEIEDKHYYIEARAGFPMHSHTKYTVICLSLGENTPIYEATM